MMTTERITRDSCCCQREPAELRSAWTLRLRSGQACEGARPHTNLRACRALLGLDGRGRPSPHEPCRLPRASRREDTREAACGKRKTPQKGKCRARAPGAPLLIGSAATVAVPAVAAEGSLALAGRCGAPPRAEYLAH